MTSCISCNWLFACETKKCEECLKSDVRIHYKSADDAALSWRKYLIEEAIKKL